MTSTRMTIYDPEGTAYEMEWCDDFSEWSPDHEPDWCDLCERTINEGWYSLNGLATFVLCDSCAKANATTEGR